jgi:predicted ATP-dependent serine protease
MVAGSRGLPETPTAGLPTAGLRRCSRCEHPLAPGTAYCGYRGCKAWTLESPAGPYGVVHVAPPERAVPLSAVTVTEDDRVGAGCWWAPLLGGGLVRGTVVLVGGEPGGGKSTLAAQMADDCADELEDLPALYIGCEERVDKLRTRMARLGCQHVDRILVPENKPTSDLRILDTIGPTALTVLDSLPYLVGRDDELAVEVCLRLVTYAQETNSPVLILTHVTKGDEFAGLMKLQHAVDVTVYLRAMHRTERRVWETIKNRFGVGFVTRDLEMTASGLELLPEAPPAMDSGERGERGEPGAL